MTQKTPEKTDAKPYVSSPMNELERKLQYPLGETLPELGHAIDVAPGVKWLRIGLPFALNHINLWLLRDHIGDKLDGQDGWTVVDCCIDQPESRAQWEQVFVNALEGLPIIRVIVTHMHPDHVGLAHWLCERWGVALWMSGTDYNVARLACSSTAGFGGVESAVFFAKHGLIDPVAQEKLRARSNYFPSLVPAVPLSYRRMMDGNLIQIGKNQWRCISGYGHAPEHIALYCEGAKILIGGDMMLPRISTNVSVYDNEPESNALQLCLDSIDKFAACAPDTLALPSHGKPFVGIHERIQQLHDHHRDRLAEVKEACQAKPCHAAELLLVMFKRELDLHQTTFAMGEVIAHLHFLWFKGELKREFCTDGIYRFSVV